MPKTAKRNKDNGVPSYRQGTGGRRFLLVGVVLPFLALRLQGDFDGS
ncbi:hypothetical protein [Glaciimonas soli]|nr:hypothetical protein [Glaciimonas soli]